MDTTSDRRAASAQQSLLRGGDLADIRTALEYLAHLARQHTRARDAE